MQVLEVGVSGSSRRSTGSATGSGAGDASTLLRQPEPEGRALALALALGADRAAVQLDQVADDRQAEAEAAVPRLVELSAWRKRSKTNGRKSAGMPMPVSVTAHRGVALVVATARPRRGRPSA